MQEKLSIVLQQSQVRIITGIDARSHLEESMDSQNKPGLPYALSAGEGWTYSFGVDFTVKAGEVLLPGRNWPFGG